MIIKDGTGTGAAAKVSADQNRLAVAANTLSGENFAAQAGDAYRVNPGVITLTTANESGLFYMKNNENRDIAIRSNIVRFGTTVSGSGNLYARFYTNPVAGTLLTSGSVFVPHNRNLGSSKTIDVDCRVGTGAALTVTDYDEITVEFIKAAAPYDLQSIIDPIFIMPKGSSLALTVTAPSGNASMQCAYTIGFFLLPLDF